MVGLKFLIPSMFRLRVEMMVIEMVETMEVMVMEMVVMVVEMVMEMMGVTVGI